MQQKARLGSGHPAQTQRGTEIGHHQCFREPGEIEQIAEVERQLEQENKNRHDLGREEFIKRVWVWKTESGGTISRQLRRMAEP